VSEKELLLDEHHSLTNFVPQWKSKSKWSAIEVIYKNTKDFLTCGIVSFVQKLAVKYGPLVIVVTIVGLFIYLLISPSKSAKHSRLNKKRR
jgi:hypothetical protein